MGSEKQERRWNSCWAKWPSIAALVVLLTSGCETGMGPASQYDAVTQADEQFMAASGRPPTLRTLYSMERVLTKQGRYPEAEFVLKRMLREYPKFTPAYSDLAEIAVRQGRTDEAVALLEKAVAIAPKDPVLHNNMGLCMLIKDSPTEARKCFDQAVTLDPENPKFMANQAMAQGLCGEMDEAMQTYLKVTTKGEAHYNIGVLCEAAKNDKRAQEEFREAAALGFNDKAEK